jgi:hypothetical protein
MRIQRPLTHGRHRCSKDATLRLAHVRATRDLDLHLGVTFSIRRESVAKTQQTVLSVDHEPSTGVDIL